jgi:adenine/guanine phosphoribosyltransferase-like PRPP-binding protein
MGDPAICTLCGFDTGALLIGIAVGLALGIAAAVIRRRPAMPDDDPHARPFADSEGGRKRG